MRGRPHRDAALLTKARLCAVYGIRWSEYPTLTLGEQKALLELLDASQAGPEPEPAPPPSVTPAPPGMERVC